MTDLDRAIAAAREALAAADASLQSNAGPKAMLDDHYDACAGCADALRDLIAALDAARGEAVAWCCPQTACDADGYPDESETPYMEWGQARPDWQGQWTPLFAAPPAAERDESPIDIGGECVPRWVIEYANELTTYFAERGGRSWAIGGVQSREQAPPAAACDCDWPLLGNCKGCSPPAAAVPAANVTPMRQPRADLARLVESINAAVYANGDGLSVTEAIGALELAKLELLKEQEQ